MTSAAQQSPMDPSVVRRAAVLVAAGLVVVAIAAFVLDASRPEPAPGPTA